MHSGVKGALLLIAVCVAFLIVWLGVGGLLLTYVSWQACLAWFAGTFFAIFVWWLSP